MGDRGDEGGVFEEFSGVEAGGQGFGVLVHEVDGGEDDAFGFFVDLGQALAFDVGEGQEEGVVGADGGDGGKEVGDGGRREDRTDSILAQSGEGWRRRFIVTQQGIIPMSARIVRGHDCSV